ncbi:MAG: sulfatase family protein [Novosphingobium sp.]|nr:sulfatase family protein [Novosphingobium sp.]
MAAGLAAASGPCTAAAAAAAPVSIAAPQVASSKSLPWIGRTAAESGPPQWPQNPRPAKGAPNILLIMTDDVGFGASSTFGGPVPTPSFDRIAAAGLRYNQFNTTALCSPSRASLLTGRMPHNVGMGNVTNISAGYEGYDSVIPRSAATVARILKDAGYNTAMLGKGHVTPDWEQSQAGPFDRWPTGLGFEYFYGFLSADTSMWAPSLVENTRPVEPPHGDPGYHFERDIADHAIRWLADQHAAAPDRPFFLYYASAAAHTPHHAPKEWLLKFRGKFDQGWDEMREQTFARQKALGVIPADAELTPRPAALPAWDSLSADQKLIAARLFEAFAAELAYSDSQIGRMLDALQRSGQLDNTAIVFIQGDNGGSAEGGPDGLLWEQAHLHGVQDTIPYMLSRLDEIGGPTLYNHFPAGWGWAENTPFQWNKQVASHFGGTRNALAISWPGHIRAGGLRSQFHHISDIAPTLLDIAAVAPPKMVDGVSQQPIDGVSMTYSFAADGPSERHTQVFEMMENLGIYHDGWFAGTTPGRAAWDTRKAVAAPIEERPWELYHIAEDFSEAHDLSAAEPRRLDQMKQLFWAEAGRNHILPLHSGGEGIAGRPGTGPRENPIVYTSRVTRVPEAVAPQLIGKAFRIEADIVVPAQGGDGVIVTQGGLYGGYALYVHEGQLTFHHNATGPRQYQIRDRQVLAAGRHMIAADFVVDPKGPPGAGTLTLSVDGQNRGSGRVERSIPRWLSHTEGLDIGEDTITAINSDYRVAQSRYPGEIEQVRFFIK